MKYTVITLLWCLLAGSTHAATGTSVSWSIGKASSTVDGIANAGPVTFTWTFDRPVTYGTYVDGTPWVIWEDGLRLTAVAPDKKTADLPDIGTDVVSGGILDATCINLKEDRLPLDGRLGEKFDAADVWDGTPAVLSAGDCIATGRGRRTSRATYRHMVFTAVGVCNIVAEDMTGHYRPPIRMPARLRAALVTPTQAAINSLPSFNVPEPKNWAGSTVALDYGKAVKTYKPDNAEDLLNGPQTNCGVNGHNWYQTAGAMLNHDLNGTDPSGYQREVSDRFATCLYDAFNPANDPARRQRSLDKFIQVGLDYFYQYCLGYPVWNGGGGHPDGIEGTITLTGALLGDSTITNAMKYQRFPGCAVGRGDTVVDMMTGTYGPFSRTEALHLVAPAAWQSDVFFRRTIGSGAATLDDCVIRFDMARADHALNHENVAYTGLADSVPYTEVIVDGSYAWGLQGGTDRLVGAVVRLSGDTLIRRICETGDAAGGGLYLHIYPALTAGERAALGSSGTLTTGICTQREAVNGEVLLWESWSADGLDRVLTSYTPSPTHSYLGNKLGDNFHWLPYYRLLDDPGVPGKKLYEENTGYRLMVGFMKMQRNFGQVFWDIFATDNYNTPRTPTIQALTRYYLLDDQGCSSFCKIYSADDRMWNEVPSAVGERSTTPVQANGAPACPGLMTRAMFLRTYPGAVLFQLDGAPVTPASPSTGIYMVKLNSNDQVQAVILCD